MSFNSFIPALPQPPHDPLFWLLDTRTGWHDADLNDIELSASPEGLALAPLPNTLPSLTEPGGSFGGLTTPANVALGPDRAVFLLDAETGQLKIFDTCDCVFKIVPCFGGTGIGPRQLQRPHGLGICSGNLFVCDTGNHRLSVFSLHGFVLRAVWRPPATKIANDWEPYDIAFDRIGRVFVSDGANGCIHRFSSSGQWQARLDGFGTVKDIAIDCRDQLYVVTEGVDGSVRVIDLDGKDISTATRSDLLIPQFPHLPFVVEPGRIHLCSLCHLKPCEPCKPCEESSCVFDLNGDPIPKPVPLAPPQFAKQGIYLSAELDSSLYKCQWHRIVIRGEIPSGTSITVMTYSGETAQTIDYIQTLPDDVWSTNQIARQLEKGLWDCLITSDQGRFLWLQIRLKGNGNTTPVIESLKIEFPRISLRQYLPAVYGEDAAGANFTDRFLSIFDTTFRSVEKQIDTEARLFDPLSAPTKGVENSLDFLSFIASWIGLTLDRQLSDKQRRQLVKRAASLYNLRGTTEGLRRQLIFFLGMEPETNCCPADKPVSTCNQLPSNCVPVEETPCAWTPPPLILEHFQLRRWLFLGKGRLGDQAVLWGRRIVNRSQLNETAQTGQTQLLTTQDPFRDPFHVYAHKFSAFVPACFGKSDSLRRGLENLVNAERPAHTQHQLIFVEPRFRIGFQSMIGLDSVVGRYPSDGITLNQTSLGSASLLSTAAHKQGGPSFEVGNQSRVGTTTKLD